MDGAAGTPEMLSWRCVPLYHLPIYQLQVMMWESSVSVAGDYLFARNPRKSWVNIELGEWFACSSGTGNAVLTFLAMFFFVSSGGAIVSSPHHSTNGDYVGDSLVLGAMDHLFCQKKLIGVGKNLTSLNTSSAWWHTRTNDNHFPSILQLQGI